MATNNKIKARLEARDKIWQRKSDIRYRKRCSLYGMHCSRLDKYTSRHGMDEDARKSYEENMGKADYFALNSNYWTGKYGVDKNYVEEIRNKRYDRRFS